MRNNGLSGKRLQKENDVVVKERNDNKFLPKIAELLNKNNYKYAPWFVSFENDEYVYKYARGKTLQKVICMPMKSILKILDMILELHKINTGKRNQVICHGDLSPVNVVYDDNLIPKMIIDWDGSYFGGKYDDIANVCLLWVNIGDASHNDKRFKKELIEIFKYLKYNREDIGNIKKILLKKQSNKNPKIPEKNRESEIRQWYKFTEQWIIKNWDYIENEATK